MPEKAVKSDWNAADMPRRKKRFVLERHFSDEEAENLKLGHVPQEMEDKWFYYFENGKLYAHRSWTGFCIYVIEFDFENDKHTVEVNADRNEYEPGSRDEERERLNSLLDRWTQPQYDYYGAWIEEIASAEQAAEEDRNLVTE